jgi:uncharacterized protein (DUF58 family)
VLTSSGVGALLCGVLLYAAAVALGYSELAELATGCVVAVGLALAWTLPRPSLTVRREIAPACVERGGTAVAVVSVVNTGRGGRSALRAEDVCGEELIGVDVPRLARRGRRTVTYRLPTARRGEVPVGPLRLVRSDPLRLVRRVQRYGESATLLVLPRVYPLPLLTSGRTRHLEGTTSENATAGTTTFHSLRAYVPGDALRHVHWRSTARTGTLMIRRLVDASRPHTTVVLDLRPEVYGEGEAFELAVDAAASIAVSAARHGFPVRVLTPAGQPMATRGSPGDVQAQLDHLARVRPGAGVGPAEELALLRRSRGGGLLALVTGRPDPATISGLAVAGHAYDRVVVVRVGDGGDPEMDAAWPAGHAVVDVANGDELVAGWRRQDGG